MSDITPDLIQDVNQFSDELKAFIVSKQHDYARAAIITAINFLNASVMHDLNASYEQFLETNDSAWMAWKEQLKIRDESP